MHSRLNFKPLSSFPWNYFHTNTKNPDDTINFTWSNELQ